MNLETPKKFQMLVDQVGRQVHADEHHLEAADEEAQRQQPEAGVAGRLAQRLDQGLLRPAR